MLSMRKSFRTRKVNDEHAGILEAVLERNSAEAIAQLTAHYRSTASILEADLKALF